MMILKVTHTYTHIYITQNYIQKIYIYNYIYNFLVNKFLKRTGLVAYGQQSWIIMQEYSSKTLDLIEATSPEYYKITVETCKPYIKLAGDIYLVMQHISFKIYDNIAEYIEKNGPLVIQTVSLNNFNA